MASEKTELRGMVSVHLAGALDAIALSKNIDRNAYVNQVLLAEVKKVARELNVIQRCARGNPLLMDGSAPTTDFGDLT